jgi:hypothetical protein
MQTNENPLTHASHLPSIHSVYLGRWRLEVLEFESGRQHVVQDAQSADVVVFFVLQSVTLYGL